MTRSKGRTARRRVGMPVADRECWTRLYAEGSLQNLPWFVQKPYPPLMRAVEHGGLSRPGPILDVGTGLGTNALWLASRGFQVTGIDIAPGAIAAAEARRPPRNRRVNFVEDDILASRLPSSQYRLAVDVGCFQTLPPRTRRMYTDNLSRVLRPHAILLLFWVGREETGSWGPPHRLSVGDVVEPLEPRFRVERIEYRPRTVQLTRQVKQSRRPLAVLAGYTAWLERREGIQPPVR
jgi:SAM-dependent methyltransferase